MRARCHRDFVLSFILAIIIHGAVGYCAGGLLLSRSPIFKPLFKSGLSSVSLTMVPPMPEEPVSKPEDAVIEEPVMQPPLIPEEPKNSESASSEDVNADVLEKGVVSQPVSTSVIRPKYPYGSRIRGEEGVVVLSAVLDHEGRPHDIEVLNSSGYQSLDRSAIRAMSKARFESESGSAVAGEKVEYTFRFQLED